MKSQNQIAIESCAKGDVVNVNGNSYTVLSKGNVHGISAFMIEIQDFRGRTKIINWYSDKQIGALVSLEEESDERIKEIKVMGDTFKHTRQTVSQFSMQSNSKIPSSGEVPEGAKIKVRWEERWVYKEDNDTISGTPCFATYCDSLDEAFILSTRLAFGITNSTKMHFRSSNDEELFSVNSVSIQIES